MSDPDTAGERIGTEKHTFGRREDQKTGDIIASGDVYLTDLNLDDDTEYWVRITSNSKLFDLCVWFKATTFEHGRRITVPKDIRVENDIMPGSATLVAVYECTTRQQQINTEPDDLSELLSVASELRTLADRLESQVND